MSLQCRVGEDRETESWDRAARSGLVTKVLAAGQPDRTLLRPESGSVYKTADWRAFRLPASICLKYHQPRLEDNLLQRRLDARKTPSPSPLIKRAQMESLPVELLELVARNLERDDLLRLSLASRHLLKVTNKLVTFCATASGVQQLRTVATALEWSYRIRNRMTTLVLADSDGTAPATELQQPDSLVASTEATARSGEAEAVPAASTEASRIMLDILANAKNVRDVQMTGFCLSVHSLSRQLAARKKLRRFAYNPLAASGTLQKAESGIAQSHFGFERLMAVLADNPGLRELHLRDLKSDAKATTVTQGDAAGPKARGPALDPFGILPEPKCSLVVLDLNRPVINDAELIKLLHVHAPTLRDLCVVFHESENMLTPAGCQTALAPCADELLSLHLGFNRSTRYPIENVLPGNLIFKKLHSVATCAIIMPRLKRLVNFPALKVRPSARLGRFPRHR